MTDAERRAKKKYREKTIFFRLELYPTDADIINKLDNVPTKAGYIKNLIREDIKKNGE